MVKGVDDSGERWKVVTLHGEICKTGKPSWKRGTLTFVASADTYLRKEILDHSCSSDTIPQQQVILQINKRKKIEGGVKSRGSLLWEANTQLGRIMFMTH